MNSVDYRRVKIDTFINKNRRDCEKIKAELYNRYSERK